MSKYIPTDNKPKGQVKAKLKVKVVFNEEEKILNEYDAFQMISDLNGRISQHEKLLQELTQAVNGIMDAMKAATQEVQPQAIKTESVDYSSLTLPKLKTTKSDGLSSDHIYPNASDKVKLQD